MAQGLAVSDVVAVNVILSPTAAVGRNFGTLLIIGSSNVIDTNERIRSYTQLGGVASDFGIAAPEYAAAAAYFGQSPQPYNLKIGRWAQQATAGSLRGAILSASVQANNLATLQATTNGNLTCTIDGTARSLSGLNFAQAANLNGVAGVVNTALGAFGTCVFDGYRFTVRSNSAGASSTVSQVATVGGGADVAGLLGLSAAAGALLAVPGIFAETAVAAVNALASLTSDWYACTFAPLAPISDNTLLQVAATIEASNPVRVMGITTQNTAAGDPLSTADIGAVLARSLYSRTLVQYSTTNPYAVASFFGRALNVNFTGSKTVLTMKFKQEPGVVPELLSETQAQALKAKHINVFAAYQNDSAIVQEGTMASGRFWDEVHGLDWLANTVQRDLFNVLYQSFTKIPQTDEGVHVLLTQMEATLSQGVENGLIAPGVWNAEGFGQLKRGDLLGKGFYCTAGLIANQSQSDREARKSPLLQGAVKLAGAIHSVDCLLNVNR